jgi:hypothetical protein
LTPDIDCVDALMAKYRDFECGLSHEGGTFWPAIRELESRLAIRPGPGAVVWTNIQKLDRNSGHLPEPLAGEVQQKFPILSHELALVQPTMVVFLTGPDYDLDIRRTFPGVLFTALRQHLAGQAIVSSTGTPTSASEDLPHVSP